MGKLLQNAPKLPKCAIWNPLVAVRRVAAETPKAGNRQFPTRTHQLISTDPAIVLQNGVFCPALSPGKLRPTQPS